MTTGVFSKGFIVPEKLVGRVGAFLLHSLAVYILALRFAPSLIAHWFLWVAPRLHVASTMAPWEWYLHHLEIVTIVPSLLAGFIVARSDDSIATWAWGVPVLVMAYKLLRYHAPSSVLIGTLGSSVSAFRYFFDIQTAVPTLIPLTNDPIRALAQLLVTAPFYAGLSYSLGALVSKKKLISRLFTFETHEPNTIS